MELRDILEKAKSELTAAMGLKPASVTQAFKDSQGWHIRLEMLEMARIPPATDLLGNYEVLLTEGGAMLSFERKGTRLRGEPTEEQRA